jgi:hypothetical protein
MTFWCGSGYGSPGNSLLWIRIRLKILLRIQLRIRLLSSLIFKDAKKKFHIFFLTCPQAHHLQSKKFNFLLKFCFKILFCWHYLSSLHTFMRKKKDPERDSYLGLMDPGGPKTYGSGSPTLLVSSKLSLFKDSITPKAVNREDKRSRR